MSIYRLFTVALSLFAVGGCSQSATDAAATVAQVGASTVAATIPSLHAASSSAPVVVAEPAAPTAAPSDSTSPATTVAPSSPLPDMGDLFAPPKLVVPAVTVKPEPEPEPEPTPEPIVEAPKKEEPLPATRLVGFVEVDGLKALLSVKRQLNVLTVGESANGVEVIAIEPPHVTLKFGQEGEEFQINLYEQPCLHPASAGSGERKTVSGKSGVSNGLSNHNSGQMTAGPGNSNGPGTIPVGAPQIPGVGPNGAPGIPGFGGMIGPPGMPGTSGNPVPGFPGPPNSSTTPNGNMKSTKKSSKSSSNSGMPGITSPPGPNGSIGGSLPAVGGALPGTGITK